MAKKIKEIITSKEYNYLKGFNPSTLDKTEADKIKEYEKKNPKIVNEFAEEYFKKVFSKQPEQIFNIDFDNLLNAFLTKFNQLEGKQFDKSRLDEVKTILYYFAKDERFFRAGNLKKDITEPSFNKGLLIIGDYGNGKTATMKTISNLMLNTPLVFKCFTANNLVNEFECIDSEKKQDKKHFFNTLKKGTKYFDDVKTERVANNFGKVNIFKEILEQRYNQRSKTYITCNYHELDKSRNLDKGLTEFADKYGGRVYDRLFEMFNIIEFNGKSLRK